MKILFVLFFVFVFSQTDFSKIITKDSRSQSLQRLIDYLNIKTIHPNPNYQQSIEFLKLQAKIIGLEYHIEEIVVGKPIFIFKYPGKDPLKPSIMFNSHMDIVAAEKEKWSTKDPFVTEIKDDKIYCRGVQDMKSVGIQHLEALDILKQMNFIPERNIFVTFVPDEEIGGEDGMEKFVNTEYFKKMNVGLEIDEGLASENDVYKVYVGERVAYWYSILFEGPVGHGSSLPSNSASEKLVTFLKKIYEFRDSQVELLKTKNIGHVISINLTGLKGGTASINVIPGNIEITVDTRIPPDQVDSFLKWFNELTNVEGVSWKLVNGHGDYKIKPLEEDNEWWMKFKKSIDTIGFKYEKLIFHAATDARYVRNVGIPAIGFSPMIQTPILLHGHDEHLSISQYFKGIEIFVELIKNLSS